MNDLEMYREQLAMCDDKIIDALVERNKIVEKIMAYKEEYGMRILQPAQEEKQERIRREKLKDSRYEKEIEDVFERIIRNSKRIQARTLFPYNIVLIGFMGKREINDFRLLKYNVCNGYRRDGSSDCRTGRNEHSGYFFYI